MSVNDVPVFLSSAQVRNLKSGGSITISPKMIEKEGKHLIHLGEGKLKKLLASLKKHKGMRVSLSEKDGEGFSLKHLGRSISRGVSKAAKTVSRGASKVAKDAGHTLEKAAKDTGKALTSKEGKIAVKSLIDVGLPIAAGAAGMVVGGPAGAAAGAAAGSLAAKEAEAHYGDMGYGFFKNGRPRKTAGRGRAGIVAGDVGLAHRSRGRQGRKDREDEKLAMEIYDLKEGGKINIGKAFKKLGKKISRGASKVGRDIGKAAKSKAVQSVGKVILQQGATAAGTAIGAYMGGPQGAIMGAKLGETLGKAGAKQIGQKKFSMKELGRSVLSESKAVAFDKIDSLIDERLTGREKEIAKAAIRGQKKGVAYGAIAYAKDKRDEVLGEMKDQAKTYAREKRDEYMTGDGFTTNSGRMITQAPDPMTLAPYARVNSAQMSPWFSNSPQLAAPVARKAVPRNTGGSIYPAGHSTHTLNRGGSFVPSGGDSGGGIYPAGMSGGAIYNPHNDPILAARNQRIGRVMRRHYKQGGSFMPA
jgi:hypothetical protein